MNDQEFRKKYPAPHGGSFKYNEDGKMIEGPPPKPAGPPNEKVSKGGTVKEKEKKKEGFN